MPRSRYPLIDEGWKKVKDDGKFIVYFKDGKTRKLTIIDGEIVEDRISETSDNEIKLYNK